MVTSKKMQAIPALLTVKGKIKVSIFNAITKQRCRDVDVNGQDFSVVEEGMQFVIVVITELEEPPSDPEMEFAIRLILSGKVVKTISRKVKDCRLPLIIDSITTDINLTTNQRMVSAMVFRSPQEVSSKATSSEVVPSSEPLHFSFSMCYGKKFAVGSSSDFESFTLPTTVVDSSSKFYERPSIAVSAVEKRVCDIHTHAFKPMSEVRNVSKWVETEAFVLMHTTRKRTRTLIEEEQESSKKKRSIDTAR